MVETSTYIFPSPGEGGRGGVGGGEEGVGGWIGEVDGGRKQPSTEERFCGESTCVQVKGQILFTLGGGPRGVSCCSFLTALGHPPPRVISAGW